MNDGGDDLYSLLSYTTLSVPSTLDTSSALADDNWQQEAAVTKNEISAVSVPLVALDDGRFVVQDNGQLYLLTVSMNHSNAEDLTKLETNCNAPNEEVFNEDSIDTSTVTVDGVQKKGIVLPDPPLVEGVKERFMFLCAQCSDVFSSVEQCRDHMIKDHNMVISNEMPEEIGEDTEFVQLPLRPIDTNSNKERGLASNETTATQEKIKKDNSDNQENSNRNSKSGAKKKSETAGQNKTDKDVNTDKEENSEKVGKTKSKRKKTQSDPDYDLRPFKCKHISCVQKFRSEESLQQHTACHQAPTRREYACSQQGCQHKSDDWRHCAMHLWQAHAIDVDLYTCTVCDQHKAASRMALETHMRIHSEERKFTCPECGKAFKQKAQLRNHRVTHIKKSVCHATTADANRPVTPRWYMEKKCDICFKMYADSKCLKKHVQAVHSKLKPYVCNVCGHSSARKAMMQAHLRQHTGEKPYACNTCLFKTGDHNSLRRHMMRHSGERPYKCPHCAYASIQSTSFKNHLQVRHPGKEGGAFTCARPHCTYRTVSHASFLQHQSDHNNNLIPAALAQPPNCDGQVFAENAAAAQLIYHCLSGGDGGVSRVFESDVTTSSTSGDGTKQTITIEIARNSSDVLTTDDEDTTHCFLQPDEVDAGGITIPADPNPGIMPPRHGTNPGTTPDPGIIPADTSIELSEVQSHSHVKHLVDFT